MDQLPDFFCVNILLFIVTIDSVMMVWGSIYYVMLEIWGGLKKESLKGNVQC